MQVGLNNTCFRKLTAGLRFLAALAESRCPACHQPFSPWGKAPADALPICPQCQSLLVPYSGPRCPQCGIPYVDEAACASLSLSGAYCPCGECLSEPPPWAQLAYYGLYEGLLQSLLLRLKYRGEFSVLPVLGAMLSTAYAALPPCDALLAVPQFPSHLRARGFNQAHELARCLAQQTGLPLQPGLLRRVRETLPQTRLSARERRQNPRDSFAADSLHGLRILLVDDTMTTGSTLRYATKALLQGGAATVMVAVVARTPPPAFRTPIPQLFAPAKST